ncbi:amino acid ABC transporter substrate-binding protein [Mucilaginibacter pallidiroseus]|uniref:Amino acid ABC transporter substrate-binding protein n=1 Tax=Mucilaginibacter pallidiroseus TaxID=2599295 RepID=A0A563UDJ2_9SPHI|nr:ABC transporter substrate-binding protein [Mucilaginibacter pallidiroseus]TWR29349.1 amino acid ABC transporter substrate-binding protein [Mucilaginibacter pallidiroseus]
MTSARNHRLPLSGNKWLFLVIAIILGACSPKVVRVPVSEKSKPQKPPMVADKADNNKPVKASEEKVSNIALILPLGLDHLAPGKTFTTADATQANLSADYYQGFKLGLDSLTAGGANFKLQVYDSKGDVAQAHSLAYNPQVRSSDLIVGPVFPDDVKSFTSVLTSARKPIVSPLSPAAPATFKNQNLVTMTPPLEYHAMGAATFIAKEMGPKKVFILSSGFSDEKLYTSPFKRTIDSLSKRKIQVVYFTVTRGNLTPLVAQLNNKVQNVFIVPSTKQSFLMVTLRSLDTLANKFPVTLFGHPNWEKYAFLKVGLLQKLKTHITSSDKIDYKATATNTFIRNYRRAYKAEPSDYSFKGFDQAMYFGELLAKDDKSYTEPEEHDFTGLHNSFHFIKKPGQGWINTHVDVLEYKNFELKKAE